MGQKVKESELLFPLCRSWQDVLDCIASLYQEQHEFKTVVLDSMDWAERLAHAKVAKDNDVTGIEKIGYGKGNSNPVAGTTTFYKPFKHR